MINATGSATPSPTPSAYIATPTPTGSLWASFPSTTPCPIDWPSWADGQVLIPMIVTPGKNTIKVQWPSRYGSTYRVTAVNQVLVTGAQPLPTWQTITTSGTGCTVTTTLTGLISNNPYIVWLDAPNTARKVDGTRDLYSGKSGVIRPL